MSRGQALFADSNGRDYSRGEKNGQALRVAFFSSLFSWMRMWKQKKKKNNALPFFFFFFQEKKKKKERKEKKKKKKKKKKN